MEEKYNAVMSDLQSIREGSNCYSISNLLNNINVTPDGETLVSNMLNAAGNSQIADGTEPLIYTPTYKFSKLGST